MAKFARAGKPRVFSFENDPEKPTKFHWQEASKDQIEEYQTARTIALSKAQSVVRTKEEQKELELLRLSFIFDRITSVENLEDQSGKSLVWGTDEEKEAVLTEFRGLPEGPKSCFLDTVMVAHFPGSIGAYKAVVGGNF